MLEKHREIPFQRKKSLLPLFLSSKYFGGHTTGFRNWLMIYGIGLLLMAVVGVLLPPATGLVLFIALIALSGIIAATAGVGVSIVGIQAFDLWNQKGVQNGKKSKNIFFALLSWFKNHELNAFLIFVVIGSVVAVSFLSPFISVPMVLLMSIAGALFIDTVCRIGNMIRFKKDNHQMSLDDNHNGSSQPNYGVNLAKEGQEPSHLPSKPVLTKVNSKVIEERAEEKSREYNEKFFNDVSKGYKF